AEGFVEKRGGQFTVADGSRSMRNNFAEGLIKGLTMTYQVERSKFDEILLRHAQENGADIREETLVTEATRVGDKWQLVVKAAERTDTLEVGWIIDASGRESFMGRKLKLKKTPLPYPGRAA